MQTSKSVIRLIDRFYSWDLRMIYRRGKKNSKRKTIRSHRNGIKK